MKKQFFRFVLPSMLAFAFSGLYSIVDGLFIGRVIGDAGLSAINFSYPLVVLIQATGAGLGLGGAVGMSIATGQKNAATKNRFLGTTLTLAAIACVLLTLLIRIFGHPVLIIFGAEGQVFDYSNDYLTWIALGAAFQVLSNTLAPILRNMGHPAFVMFTMIGGFITNILLDWLFIVILGQGMAGAALATVIGQLVTVIPCVLLLLRYLRPLPSKDYRPRKSVTLSIIKTGLSPFGLALAPYIILIMMNKATMVYGGVVAVAAYSVVSYIVSFIQLLLQGIGDGCQPLMSVYLGQKENKKAIIIRNYAYGFAFITAAAYALIVFILRHHLPLLFGSSQDVAQVTATILPLFCLAFLFYSFTRVTTSYFYAIKKNLLAYVIIYGEPIMVFVLLAFILPKLLGLQGVWATVPIAQFFAFVISLVLIFRSDKHLANSLHK